MVGARSFIYDLDRSTECVAVGVALFSSWLGLFDGGFQRRGGQAFLTLVCNGVIIFLGSRDCVSCVWACCVLSSMVVLRITVGS